MRPHSKTRQEHCRHSNPQEKESIFRVSRLIKGKVIVSYYPYLHTYKEWQSSGRMLLIASFQDKGLRGTQREFLSVVQHHNKQCFYFKIIFIVRNKHLKLSNICSTYSSQLSRGGGVGVQLCSEGVTVSGTLHSDLDG